MSNILYMTSEVFPLIKTGGLADVAGSLPAALLELDQDFSLQRGELALGKSVTGLPE